MKSLIFEDVLLENEEILDEKLGKFGKAVAIGAMALGLGGAAHAENSKIPDTCAGVEIPTVDVHASYAIDRIGELFKGFKNERIDDIGDGIEMCIYKDVSGKSWVSNYKMNGCVPGRETKGFYDVECMTESGELPIDRSIHYYYTDVQGHNTLVTLYRLASQK